MLYRSLIVLAACAALAACGGGGGGGQAEEPVAGGLVVGQQVNQVDVVVRSGSEVTLNGENSDGTRYPLVEATWRQTDNTGVQVRLDKRTDRTRVFRAPFVDEEVTLTFELLVTNTAGEKAKTEVRVTIIPFQDSDRFLEFVQNVAATYTVVATLRPGATALTDVPFTVTQSELVDYADLTASSNVPNQTGIAINEPVTRPGTIPAGFTGSTNVAGGAIAFQNPNLAFTIPKIDLDDINAEFPDDDPSSIDLARVDSVVHFVELTLDVSGGSCERAGSPVSCADEIAVSVSRADGTAVAFVRPNVVRVGDLASVAASTDGIVGPDSPDIADRYYAAIDPDGRRTTLSDWLELAGFPSAPPGEVNHTIYINNYDLGFTRSMYTRLDAATGNVYAYVVNLPALRPAILRTDDLESGRFDPTTIDEDVLATVVMEYTPPDQNPGDPNKFTKFFVYVPDGTGEQVRVKSLNFDGRGEKYVPGACTPCHGGEPRPLGADGNYAANGDIDAAFLPWDLDSFLYADADNPREIDPLVIAGLRLTPTYLTAEQLRQYSRPEQEQEFRKMNEAVLATMKHKTPGDTRFVEARKLIHGWYGNTDAAGNANDTGDTLPAVPFDGLFIPAGWRGTGDDDFYTDVFGRHCRICHLQNRIVNQFATADTFLAFRDDIDARVFRNRVMPNARLDMDRFWVDFHGDAVPPAERFATFLGVPDFDALSGPVVPVAAISAPPSATAVADDANVVLASLQGAVRLDGTASAFAESFAWTVTDAAGSPTSGAEILGADTAYPVLRVLDDGTYTVSLTVARTTTDGQVLTASNSAEILANANTPVQTGQRQPFTISESLEGDLQSMPITPANLEWTDLDSAPDAILFAVVTPPATGTLTCSGAPCDSFTQQDINDNQVVYTEGGPVESGVSDGFIYSVLDGDGNPVPNNLFTIAVVQRNDVPVQIRNGPLLVLAGEERPITQTELLWKDDDVGAVIEFTVVEAPTFGDLLLNGVPLAAGDSFGPDDICEAGSPCDSLTYRHDGTRSPVDSFRYTVTDFTTTLSPEPFAIQVTLPGVAPTIATSPLTVPAGLTTTLSSANVQVSDADSALADLTITVTVAPQRGTILVGGSPAGDFSAQELQDGLVAYRHTAGATDATDDEVTLRVADNDLTTADAQATLEIDVAERTDTPMFTGQSIVTLDGYLDGARSRTGGEFSWLGNTADDDPPYRRIALTAAITFEPGALEDPAKCSPLQLTLTRAPSLGRILLGDTPVPEDGTFTQDDVDGGAVSYENQAIDEATDSFDVQASDCVLTTNQTIGVQRHIDPVSDVGWVIDSVWTDSPAGIKTCRSCHAPGLIAGQAPFNFPWTTSSAPGGTIQCTTLMASAAQLPEKPAGLNGHTGGNVIGAADTNPHKMLVQWEEEGFRGAGSVACP